jgi:EAL domain-containing protein (putative c-di-GMP-specific phosphodiesterase class I)
VANLEPEFVKIDMSIVRGVDSSPMKRRLIGALGPACRDASIRIVAEGIETLAELDAVRELGCDLVQGFLLARPASPAPRPSWPGTPPG